MKRSYTTELLGAGVWVACLGNGEGIAFGDIIQGSYLVMGGLRLRLIRLRLVPTEGIGSTILKGV